MDVTQVLYDWWLERFERHERQAQATRKLLGYADTELCPKRLTKAEFIRRLRHPGRAIAVKQRWLNRLIAGHESDLDQLPDHVQAFVRDCGANPPIFLDLQQPNELRDAS